MFVDNESYPGVLSERMAVARGEQPADLLLKNARLINFFTGKAAKTNIALHQGYIAAIGETYKSGNEIIDLNGAYVAPGFIDAHLHIESTLLFPPELARILIVNGTTAVINDPHEIGNVMGIKGVKMMLDASKDLPVDFFFTVPSCVPSTDMETAGGKINADQIRGKLKHPRVVGLGEMMNYPGVINAEKSVMNKLAAAHEVGKVVDGHAPGLTGNDLQAYLSAGIGTDHECLTANEALEKLKSGMKIIIRHGSASSSLGELIPLVNQTNVDSFMFGSDDREAAELLGKGHLNDLLKRAVSMGADPYLAIRIATFNPARHYRLFDRGLIAPGYTADLAVIKDLKDFEVVLVVKNGKIVSRQGRPEFSQSRFLPPGEALNSVKVKQPLTESDFKISVRSKTMPVIGVVPGQLITEKLSVKVEPGKDGSLRVDPDSGLNKIAVIERHHASGRMAVALVQGIGLKEGALASSVAHDSHNIIVVGVEESAMAVAVNKLADAGGGFIAVGGRGEIKSFLPLEIGGLMSLKTAEEVAGEMDSILKAASELGAKLPHPFLTLSFLALPVIPSLKITDRGLFDVDNFSFL